MEQVSTPILCPRANILWEFLIAIVFNGLSQKRKGLTILSSYQRFDHKTSDRTYQAVAFGDMRRFQLKSNAKGIEMDQFFQVT
jgi:hypothetical protein